MIDGLYPARGSAVLALLLAAHPAMSASIEDVRYCTDWQVFARIVMEGRQAGIPFKHALDNAADAARASGEHEQYDLALAIIWGAYQKKIEDTDRGATAAAIRFAEEQFAICLTSKAD